jgi:hypothetical protein
VLWPHPGSQSLLKASKIPRLGMPAAAGRTARRDVRLHICCKSRGRGQGLRALIGIVSEWNCSTYLVCTNDKPAISTARTIPHRLDHKNQSRRRAAQWGTSTTRHLGGLLRGTLTAPTNGWRGVDFGHPWKCWASMEMEIGWNFATTRLGRRQGRANANSECACVFSDDVKDPAKP